MSPLPNAAHSSGPSPSHRFSGKAVWPIAAVLIFTSFVWSLGRIEVNWPWFGIYPVLDPDSLLYLRWLEQSLLQGKQLMRDLYMSYPNPQHVQISPLYREFLYRISLLCHLFHGGEGFRVESLLAFLPPIAGMSLQVALVASLIRRRVSTVLVVLTAFASLPGFSHFATFDYFQLDHHWAEVLCIGLWLILGDWFCTERRADFVIAGGFIMAVFMGTWSGSPQFVALMLGLLLARWIASVETVVLFCEYYSGTMLIGAGVMALYLLKYPETAALTPFSGFGWVQVVLTGLAGGFSHLLLGLERFWPRRAAARLGLALVIAAAGLLLVQVIYPVALEKAGDFFAKKSRVIRTIAEMRPVLEIGKLAAIHSQLTLQLAYWGVYPLFVLLPMLSCLRRQI